MSLSLFSILQCSASVGMKAFFDMMDKDPRKVMILGGSCTSVTDSIAKTSKHWRIPVVRKRLPYRLHSNRHVLPRPVRCCTCCSCHRI